MIKHYYLPLLNAGFMNKVNIVLEKRIILPALLKASQKNILRFRMRSRGDTRKIIREHRRRRPKKFTSQSQRDFFDVTAFSKVFFYCANPFNCIFIAALCTARCFPLIMYYSLVRYNSFLYMFHV